MIELLRSVLALDSISQYLNFYERIQVHKKILEMIKYKKEIDTQQLPLKVRQSIQLIKKHNWERLECKYNEGRLSLTYYDEVIENWAPIENYKHKILTEIKTIK